MNVEKQDTFMMAIVVKNVQGTMVSTPQVYVVDMEPVRLCTVGTQHQRRSLVWGVYVLQRVQNRSLPGVVNHVVV